MTAIEQLGPAERIIGAVLNYADHMTHNRPGMTVPDGSAAGVKWTPVTYKDEGEPKQRIVYTLTKVGKKTQRTRIGVMATDGQITEGGRVVGKYQPAGLFIEVATLLYRQVAEVWKLDNEFAARWASYAYSQEHRDLKVALAAFMLVQTRKGDPVLDGGKVIFHDEDFRDVGEAMMLLLGADKAAFNPKLLLRVHDLLALPSIAAINRELGFGRSPRHPFFGRWAKTVEKWLRYREENPRLLDGLVKAGFRTTVMELARRAGYKPETPRFFEALRWKQAQADDGRRTLAIGAAVTAAETWAGKTEAEVCTIIEKTKPNWKRVVGLVPKELGITRAIMAAAIESGGLSDKDLIIATPTLEELGLLEVQDIKARWERAVRHADDMRAANIATRVKAQATKEALNDAADNAVKAAVAEVVKGLRVYFMVDISGSMEGAIEAAKGHIARFLQGFPQDKVHIATFNTTGREIKIPHASAAGVQNAFTGIRAGGGTDYGAGVRTLQHLKPQPDEDVLFIFIGDEEATDFSHQVRMSNLNPLAFGFLKVRGPTSNGMGTAVRETAQALRIPCFMIDDAVFSDVYAIPRTIRALIAATPVGPGTATAAPKPRRTLVDTILQTELLKKPAWAA